MAPPLTVFQGGIMRVMAPKNPEPEHRFHNVLPLQSHTHARELFCAARWAQHCLNASQTKSPASFPPLHLDSEWYGFSGVPWRGCLCPPATVPTWRAQDHFSPKWVFRRKDPSLTRNSKTTFVYCTKADCTQITSRSKRKPFCAPHRAPAHDGNIKSGHLAGQQTHTRTSKHRKLDQSRYNVPNRAPCPPFVSPSQHGHSLSPAPSAVRLRAAAKCKHNNRGAGVETQVTFRDRPSPGPHPSPEAAAFPRHIPSCPSRLRRIRMRGTRPTSRAIPHPHSPTPEQTVRFRCADPRDRSAWRFGGMGLGVRDQGHITPSLHTFLPYPPPALTVGSHIFPNIFVTASG